VSGAERIAHDPFSILARLKRLGPMTINSLAVTEAGAERLRAAIKGWVEAQTRFEAVFGATGTSALRALLRAVSKSDLGVADSNGIASDARS
jgi:hypothetical protein